MCEVEVMKEQWNYLVVLDACRYDYFSRLYSNYLTGTIHKRLSVGTGTKIWRNRSFTDYYEDTIYVSANPYINSVVPVKGFNGADHFYKIFDLWADFWDEAKGTVLPEVVTKEAIKIVKEYPNKKAIIHYIQPHEPYLGIDSKKQNLNKTGLFSEAWARMGELNKKPLFSDRLMRIIDKVFYQIGIRGYGLLWRVREKLGITPAQPMDSVRREFGDEGLRKAYEDNLKTVLPHVKELVEHLSGRIIITADHGEMLGEDGCYCHWSRATNKQLREIPWLVIDKGPKTEIPPQSKKMESGTEFSEMSDAAIKQKLMERLKDLGYY